jgi:hypothetical protein
LLVKRSNLFSYFKGKKEEKAEILFNTPYQCQISCHELTRGRHKVGTPHPALLVKEVTYFLISKVRKRRRLKTSSTHLSTARYHVMSLPETVTKLACHILPCLLKVVTYFLISKTRKRRRLKTYSTHLINARYHVMSLPEQDTKLAGHILLC